MAEQSVALALRGGTTEPVLSRAWRWMRQALGANEGIVSLARTSGSIVDSPPALAPQSPTPTSDPQPRRRSDFSGPDQSEYREIPTIATTEWDRVPEIRAILRELEQGYFQRASLLSLLQERDDRIAGCWAIRTDTLLGVPLEFEPALIDGAVTEESAAVADAAEVDWPKMFPEGSLDRLFKQGKDLGLSVGELIVREDEETGRWIPRLKAWNTQWVWWNWGTESYWINTSGAYDEDGSPVNNGVGVIELPRVDRDVYSDGHWVVYTPGGWRYAYWRGLLRPLALLHLKRQWDFRDWSRFNEVYGMLIRKAITPMGASDSDKARFARDIRNLGSETTVETPQDPEKGKYDIEIAGPPSGAGSGNDTFGNSLHYVDECIGNLLLGQQASGEKKSSLGSGDDQQNEKVRQDILEKDARIYETLRLQVLHHWTLWNFGDASLTPTVNALVDPPETTAHKAEKMKAAGEAASAIKAAFPTADMAALAAELDIPLLAPGEVPIHTEPDGDEDEAGNEPPGHDESAEQPPPIGGKLSVRALKATVRSKRAPGYVDKLAAASTAAGTRAIAPDLADIGRIVRESQSPEELRAALVAKYRAMDPGKFADVVERADIMARLAGKYEVIDNL